MQVICLIYRRRRRDSYFMYGRKWRIHVNDSTMWIYNTNHVATLSRIFRSDNKFSLIVLILLANNGCILSYNRLEHTFRFTYEIWWYRNTLLDSFGKWTNKTIKFNRDNWYCTHVGEGNLTRNFFKTKLVQQISHSVTLYGLPVFWISHSATLYGLPVFWLFDFEARFFHNWYATPRIHCYWKYP